MSPKMSRSISDRKAAKDARESERSGLRRVHRRRTSKLGAGKTSLHSSIAAEAQSAVLHLARVAISSNLVQFSSMLAAQARESAKTVPSPTPKEATGSFCSSMEPKHLLVQRCKSYAATDSLPADPAILFAGTKPGAH